MNAMSRIGLVTGVLAAGVGAPLGSYAAFAAVAWRRYGRVPQANGGERDDLLEQFMPMYEVVERHQTTVAAPAATTLSAARDQDILQVPLVRAIFRTREIVLRAARDGRAQQRDLHAGLIDTVRALGWGILAEIPDRELVVGAVTKPWEPHVTFRTLPPNDFAQFSEPGFVKIVWTLRADPVDDHTSIFRTETRAVATDATARARFRRYWQLTLRPVKREAERRAQIAQDEGRACSADPAVSRPAQRAS
jgi:hypothetical protein